MKLMYRTHTANLYTGLAASVLISFLLFCGRSLDEAIYDWQWLGGACLTTILRESQISWIIYDIAFMSVTLVIYDMLLHVLCVHSVPLI